MSTNDLATAVDALLQERGWSQAELHRQSGLAESTIIKILRGEGARADTLRKLDRGFTLPSGTMKQLLEDGPPDGHGAADFVVRLESGEKVNIEFDQPRVPPADAMMDLARRSGDEHTTTVKFFETESGRQMLVTVEHGQVLADISAAVGAAGLVPKVLDRFGAEWDAEVAAFDGDELAGLIIVADAGDDPWGFDQAIDHAERSAFRAQRQAPGVRVTVYMTGDLPDDLEPHVQLLIDAGVAVVVEPQQLAATLRNPDR